MAMNAVGGRCPSSANASPSSISLADTYTSAQTTRVHPPKFLVKGSRIGKKYSATERVKRTKGKIAIGIMAIGIIVTARDVPRQIHCST